MDETFPYLIAVDGGGTSCRFAIAAPSGRVELKLGSANAFSDRLATLRTLEAGLKGLVDEIGLPHSALAEIPVYAGLAGVTDEGVATEIAKGLPSTVVEVEDDRRSAVVGALQAKTGTVIGVGTGSFLARQVNGGIRFIGGYGSLLGDQASGYWLGAGLLRHVLLAMDGMRPHSPLTREVSTNFDNDPIRIITFSGSAQPTNIADFAPRIVAAAEEGDRIGLELMQKGADYLAAGLTALGHSGDEPICALGGVASHYRRYLPERFRDALAEPAGTALDGAMTLAVQLAERSKLEIG